MYVWCIWFRFTQSNVYCPLAVVRADEERVFHVAGDAGTGATHQVSMPGACAARADHVPAREFPGAAVLTAGRRHAAVCGVQIEARQAGEALVGQRPVAREAAGVAGNDNEHSSVRPAQSIVPIEGIVG